MRRFFRPMRTVIAALAPAGLAVLAVGCGGGSSGASSPGAPSAGSGDRLTLSFSSTITSTTTIAGATVTTTSEVNASGIPLSPGSTGPLRYTKFEYTFSRGGCTFRTTTTDGSLTVVEADASIASPLSARILLRPANTIRESIDQACSTTSVTIPGIYWWSGWQLLHQEEARVASGAWEITGLSAGSGSVAASRSYKRSEVFLTGGAGGGAVEYTEDTTIALIRS